MVVRAITSGSSFVGAAELLAGNTVGGADGFRDGDPEGGIDGGIVGMGVVITGAVVGSESEGSFVGFKLLTEGARDKDGKELGCELIGCELILGATLVVGAWVGWEETVGYGVGGVSNVNLQ